MSDASTVTWEEASRCPGICGRQMVEVGKQRAQTGDGLIHILECQQELCNWYEERKLVQTMKDGSIPIRKPEKEFKAFTPQETSQFDRVLKYNEEILRRKDMGELG